MEKLIRTFFVLAFLVFSSLFVSAGLGIKYGQESAMVNEGDETCLSYGVYNPWPDDSNVIIGVSDSLKEILIQQEAETKFVPKFTPSQDAIPIKFCFKVPQVYSRNCAVVGKFLCELTCKEDLKVYEGEVSVSTLPMDNAITGTGGSATMAVAGAPLRIRVACNPFPRNYTLLYVLIALISATAIGIIFFMRYRRPKIERDKERVRKLKEEIKKESLRKKK